MPPLESDKPGDGAGTWTGVVTRLSRRQVAFALAVLILAGACLWWWLAHRSPAVVWQGYAEADYVKVGPTQQGLLTEVSVARGDLVAVGAPLFAQDETSDRAARDQAARQLAQAEGQLANLQAGGKLTEIEQAEANLADARATLTRAQDDLQRGEAEFRIGAVSKQDFEHLQADSKSAKAKVQALAAALAQMRAPLGRDQEIKAQSEAADAARAALAIAEWRLAQRRVTAPVGGRVADVIAFPGETLAAGAPVVSLLPPENIFVRFFVPETALSGIHRGDSVALACDSCPPDLTAEISFIAPQAEYTPPVIYSESSSSKLVYLIEARPRPDQAKLMNPGQPIEVRPAGTGHSQ
jgi:HlyD family secretion protein